ncbi:MAG: hypothetical protein U0736_03820 [Gemmataceae bacterium]
MLFSVIYSVDVPSNVSLKAYTPTCPSLWTRTEGDEQYEYGYLEVRWEKGKHRKWTAVLTRDQFDAFVEKLGLVAEDVQTMGSLGAPGFGFGWAPAISFNGDDQDAILNAYVTPVSEIQKDGFDEQDWQRVREAVLKVYGRRRNRAA